MTFKDFYRQLKKQKEGRHQNITLTIGLECSEHFAILKLPFYCTGKKKNDLKQISRASSLRVLLVTFNRQNLRILILRSTAANEEGGLTK